MSTEVLLNEARKLSVPERIRLVEDICASIDADPSSYALSDEQRQELDRRLADYRADPHAGSPWDDVKARILNRP